MRAQYIAALFLIFLSLALPATVRAQSATGGAIAGVVKDATGAVLPGVTVEAASPALIEKVRTAVTDDQGQYKIVELRSGLYTVTFTLAGFNTFKREGIELTAGFTAAVNGDLKVGSLEETVTVTGASPVVDIQNVRKQTLITREVLDTLPTTTSSQGLAAITLGATLGTAPADVGGNRGESVASTGIHGNRGVDSVTTIDGVTLQELFMTGSGVYRHYKINQVMAQEVTIATDGLTAEYETGGVVTNIVPKDGGNNLKFFANTSYSGKRLQSSNLTDELKLRGLPQPPFVKRIIDIGIGAGGPIKKDRVWFYTAHRKWAASEETAGLYYNKTPHTLFYEPDLSRPAFTDNQNQDQSLRVTWQASQKNKVNFNYAFQNNCTCPRLGAGTALQSPEASQELHRDHMNFVQVTWSLPATNRLLFEAGGSYLYDVAIPKPIEGSKPEDISITDSGIGLTYGAINAALSSQLAPTIPGRPNHTSPFISRVAGSYITGSHAFKLGLNMLSGMQDLSGQYTQPYAYTLRNGVPQSITIFASPHYSQTRVKMNLGLYAQDQWTLSKLTLNLGVRLSRLNAYVPDQVRPAGQFVPELRISKQDNLPNWNDVDPRLGAAYDLFGNGKSAVKVSLGRYVGAEQTSIAQAVNPANAMVTQVNRNWNDTTFPVGDPRRGNYVPDCDLKNPLANGECGQFDNLNFGTILVNTHYANDVVSGFRKRPYTWQGLASFQQELWPGTAVTVGYFRTWYGNFRVTDNLSIAPADFDPFCITVPSDARLPGGGGNQLCGFYDIRPAAFGLADNLVNQAAQFGKQTQVFNGVDASINSRFGKGGMLSGGVSTGRTVTDDCNVIVDSPQKVFCKTTLPFAGQTQIKLQGVYPLGIWDLQASATYQNLPGFPIAASYVATNAQILPSLGRNLGSCRGAATCAATVTIPNIIEPFTMFEHRLNQLDLRLTKNIRIGHARVRGNFDVYNAINAATIIGLNTRYGAAWLTPSAVLPGRLLKLGGQLDF